MDGQTNGRTLFLYFLIFYHVYNKEGEVYVCVLDEKGTKEEKDDEFFFLDETQEEGKGGRQRGLKTTKKE